MIDNFIYNLSSLRMDVASRFIVEKNEDWLSQFNEAILDINNFLPINVNNDFSSLLFFEGEQSRLSNYCHNMYTDKPLNTLFTKMIMYNRRNRFSTNASCRKLPASDKFIVYEIVHKSESKRFFDASPESNELVPLLVRTLHNEKCLGISTFFDQSYMFKSTQIYFSGDVDVPVLLKELSNDFQAVLSKRVMFNQRMNIQTYESLRIQSDLNHSFVFLESLEGFTQGQTRSIDFVSSL